MSMREARRALALVVALGPRCRRRKGSNSDQRKKNKVSSSRAELAIKQGGVLVSLLLLGFGSGIQ